MATVASLVGMDPDTKADDDDGCPPPSPRGLGIDIPPIGQSVVTAFQVDDEPEIESDDEMEQHFQMGAEKPKARAEQTRYARASYKASRGGARGGACDTCHTPNALRPTCSPPPPAPPLVR